MKQFMFRLVSLGAITLAGLAGAGPDSTNWQSCLEVALVDGSRFIGTTSIESMPVETPYGTIDIDIRHVRWVNLASDHKTAVFDMRNTDTIKGRINLTPITLTTGQGVVKIAPEHIRDIYPFENPLEADLKAPIKDFTLDLGGEARLELVHVQPGEFMMAPGTSNPKAHNVTVTNGFWIGRYEVTQEQWQQVMGSNPSCFKGTRNPVEQVTWNDCQDFMAVVNQQLRMRGLGLTARLPTEAEWEYAAKGGTQGKDKSHAFSGSDNLNEVAWHEDNSKGTAHPVGGKQANELGIHDMSGNVREWCQDWTPNYLSTWQGPGPALPTMRGSSWIEHPRIEKSWTSCQARGETTTRSSSIGFRIVMVR